MPRPIDFSWLEGIDGLARRQLDRQPVVLALAAVQFFPVLKVDRQDYIANFQEAIRDQYPDFEPAQAGPNIQIRGPGVVIDPAADAPRHWLFHDATRSWTVTLTRESIGLESRSYAGYEDFRARLRTSLDALIEHIVPTQGTRVGLRYLDELRPLRRPEANESGGEVTDWASIVRPELLGIAATPAFQGRVHQSLHRLSLRDRDGVGININHGIIPGGSMIDPPSAVSKEYKDRPFYALDTDAFQEAERGHQFAMNTESTLDRLDSLHDAISRIFRWMLQAEHMQGL